MEINDVADCGACSGRQRDSQPKPENNRGEPLVPASPFPIPRNSAINSSRRPCMTPDRLIATAIHTTTLLSKYITE
jgi:hypothetical protein